MSGTDTIIEEEDREHNQNATYNRCVFKFNECTNAKIKPMKDQLIFHLYRFKNWLIFITCRNQKY